MQSTQARQFVLRMTPEDIKNNLKILVDDKLDLGPIPELTRATVGQEVVLDVHELYKKITEEKKVESKTILSLEDHLAFAKILARAPEPRKEKPSILDRLDQFVNPREERLSRVNACLDALKNTFGAMALEAFKSGNVKCFRVYDPKKKQDTGGAPGLSGKTEKKAAPVESLETAPRQVAPEDLTSGGRLRLISRSAIVKAVKEAKNPSGRFGKKELEKNLRLKTRPTCGVDCFKNGKNQLKIVWLYKGRKYRIEHYHDILNAINELKNYKKIGSGSTTIPKEMILKILEAIPSLSMPEEDCKLANRLGLTPAEYKAYQKDKETNPNLTVKRFKEIQPKKEPATCGVRFRLSNGQIEEITWLFDTCELKEDPVVSGSKHGRGMGGAMSVGKIAQEDRDPEEKREDPDDDDWRFVKIMDVCEGEQEFKVLNKEDPNVTGRIVRHNKPKQEVVMRWSRGKNLDETVKSGATFHPLIWAKIFWDICEVVDRFHETHQSFHRDIKPANFMLYGMKPTIIDFGFSRTWDSKKAIIVKEGEYDVVASAGYASKDAHNGVYNVSTEMFSLALTLGFLAGFLSAESRKKVQEYEKRHKANPTSGETSPAFELITKESEAFKKANTVFFDEKDRAEGLDFLDSMMHKPPSQGIPACSGFFKSRFDKMKSSCGVLQVCLVNYNEWLEDPTDGVAKRLMDYAHTQQADKSFQFHIVQFVKFHRKYDKRTAILKNRLWDDRPHSIFLERRAVNLVDYPVSDLMKQLEGAEWYVPGVRFEFTFVSQHFSNELKESLEKQKVKVVELPGVGLVRRM